MISKEQGLLALEALLRPLMAVHSLKLFKRDIDFQVTEEYMPCLLIIEGDDTIIKTAGRSYISYPCIRQAEIVVEVWEASTGDVRTFRNNVIQRAFANGPQLLPGVVIKEQKTTGPFNMGIYGYLGMQIHFLMTYPDNTTII
jgi:hypothetical protein